MEETRNKKVTRGLADRVPADREATRARIIGERDCERQRTFEELLGWILEGNPVRASGHLLFHTQPDAFLGIVNRLLTALDSRWTGADAGRRRRILDFLTKLRIDLCSFLPHWHLGRNMPMETISAAADQVLMALKSCEARAPEITDLAVADLLKLERSRLAAEGLEEAEATRVAAELVGTSPAGYADRMAAWIASSNLTRVAKARLASETRTEFGNDYATFLQHAIWLGASFVTTNPVLIKVAWDTDPGLWTPRVDGLIAERFSSEELRALLAGSQEGLEGAIAQINAIVTTAVVVENCRLLRDIFLLTEGAEGYVSLQVNPNLHNDHARMVAEVRVLHGELERALGGVPNVVFKLPSTAAGLAAAREITSEGIGVTITLTFSVLQSETFARVLSQGKALICYIAIMNGRMAFPVRDELAAKQVPQGIEAARWAGVEVARKACRRLYEPPQEGGLGVDPNRVKIMIASLRIYEDWLPDISELWGVPVITIFPNVRRAYDRHERELDGDAIAHDTPRPAIETLLESEIFRQAWWVDGDPQSMQPKNPLSMKETAAATLAAWKPMADTFDQFIDLYGQMGRMVVDRMRSLAQ
jgi:transaldolase